MKTRKKDFVFVTSISNNKLFAKKRISELKNFEFQKVATKNFCYDIYAKPADVSAILSVLDK